MTSKEAEITGKLAQKLKACLGRNLAITPSNKVNNSIEFTFHGIKVNGWAHEKTITLQSDGFTVGESSDAQLVQTPTGNFDFGVFFVFVGNTSGIGVDGTIVPATSDDGTWHFSETKGPRSLDDMLNDLALKTSKIIITCATLALKKQHGMGAICDSCSRQLTCVASHSSGVVVA